MQQQTIYMTHPQRDISMFAQFHFIHSLNILACILTGTD